MSRMLFIVPCMHCPRCTMEEGTPFCYMRDARWIDSEQGLIHEADARALAEKNMRMAYWVAKADYNEK